MGPEAKFLGILEESWDQGRDLTVELHGSGEGRGAGQQQQVPTVLHTKGSNSRFSSKNTYKLKVSTFDFEERGYRYRRYSLYWRRPVGQVVIPSRLHPAVGIEPTMVNLSPMKMKKCGSTLGPALMMNSNTVYSSTEHRLLPA